MNKTNAIEINNLSKQYKLGTVGTGTISHDLKRWWHLVRGKEDPYLKIGDTNDRSLKSDTGYVWALKDINFEVPQGEVLGIIGKNGAGKSTLLKILSKVTGPTTGTINYRGRIGALLEVGTGFHPELTGRENIYLNGTILGMTKQEINYKFDDIVDFSGCGKYVDTPVKRYSSGMMVRLGFAVAAFLEPEILVVDEVLAVGDAEFQKRAIGKMQDVSKNDGRTVLFVSHNMGSVRNLCRSGILLENGQMVYSGTSNDTVERYLNQQAQFQTQDINLITSRRGNGNLHFTNAILKTSDGKERSDFLLGEPMEIEIFFEKKLNKAEIYTSRIDLMINDKNGDVVTWMSTSIFENNFLKERNSVVFKIDKILLNHGFYDLTLYSEINDALADRVQNVKGFSVLFNDYYKTGKEIVKGQCSLVSDFKIS